MKCGSINSADEGFHLAKSRELIGIYRKMAFELTKRITLLLFALTSIGFGASLFILSNIGSDPFNVLMQGLSDVFNVTVGQANIMVSLIYASIIFLWDRKHLRIGTLIAVVALGTFIDLGIYLLTPFFLSNIHFWVRFLTMIAGSAFIAFGVAIVYCTKIGMVPNDAIPVILSDKLNFPFKWVRIGYDLLAVTAGIIMGGVFGIGTIICALITGPLISFFIPYVECGTRRIFNEPVMEGQKT